VDGCPVGSTSSSCNACASNNDCIRGNSCVIGTCNAGTCSFDTTSCPGNFEMNLRTDSWGLETSWQLVNTCSGNTVLQGGPYRSDTQISASQVIGQGPHKFVLNDSAENGFSGSGQLTATVDGLEVAQVSGNFKYDEIFFFGSGECGVPVPNIPVPAPAPVNPADSSSSPGTWKQIFFEGFERGRGSAFSRGSLARITRSRVFSGRYAVQITDDRAGSAITSTPMDCSSYKQLQINFQFYADSVDQGEKFFLDYSSSGMSSFRSMYQFTSGQDFQNGEWLFTSLSWDIVGTTRGSVRIRSDFTHSRESITINQITLLAL